MAKRLTWITESDPRKPWVTIQTVLLIAIGIIVVAMWLDMFATAIRVMRHVEAECVAPNSPQPTARTHGEAGVRACVPPQVAAPALDSLLAAIRMVETGGNDNAVGDNGRSRGVYQCGCAAWADGGGNPAEYDRLVWNRAACEAVMVRYWARYGCRTDEQKSRAWNGGPDGWRRASTVGYWNKVRAAQEGEK